MGHYCFRTGVIPALPGLTGMVCNEWPKVAPSLCHGSNAGILVDYVIYICYTAIKTSLAFSLCMLYNLVLT